MTKDIQPGNGIRLSEEYRYGETVEEALRRKSVRVRHLHPQFITRYVFESAIEKELVNTFRTIYNGEIKPDTEELDGGRFWSLKEIKSNLGQNVFYS